MRLQATGKSFFDFTKFPFRRSFERFDSARVINFLHDRGPHVVDQHAVIISVNPAIAGYAEAVSARGRPGTRCTAEHPDGRNPGT